jgi:hypothetical protein
MVASDPTVPSPSQRITVAPAPPPNHFITSRRFTPPASIFAKPSKRFSIGYPCTFMLMRDGEEAAAAKRERIGSVPTATSSAIKPSSSIQ